MIDAVSLTNVGHQKRICAARSSVDAASVVHHVGARKTFVVAGTVARLSKARAAGSVRTAGRPFGGALLAPASAAGVGLVRVRSAGKQVFDHTICTLDYNFLPRHHSSGGARGHVNPETLDAARRGRNLSEKVRTCIRVYIHMYLVLYSGASLLFVIFISACWDETRFWDSTGRSRFEHTAVQSIEKEENLSYTGYMCTKSEENTR